jgi:hypothetical protein
MMSCKLFWRSVRFTYPWLSLVIILWRMAHSTDVERHRAQVRFWILVTRIDFANLLAIAIDMIQPEYWS